MCREIRAIRQKCEQYWKQPYIPIEEAHAVLASIHSLAGELLRPMPQIVKVGEGPLGYEVFRSVEEGPAGEYHYYTDECGVLSEIWDTAVTGEGMLLAAILAEQTRRANRPRRRKETRSA